MYKRMIASKSDYLEFLRVEGVFYNCLSRADNVRCFLKFLGGSEMATIWHYQRLLRRTEYYRNCNKLFRYKLTLIVFNRISNKYGIHIGLNTFEKGLRIMHLGSILVNGNVHVGEFCTLHINTALVAKGNASVVPTLGDHIVIGVGATIVGDVVLADGIAVGAHSLVNHSFLESNITVAGVPARKISSQGSITWGR